MGRAAVVGAQLREHVAAPGRSHSECAHHSWTHARELLRRFLSHSHPGNATITDLDAARARLLASQSTSHPHEARETVEQWDAYLRHLLDARATSGAELCELLTSLQHLQSAAARPGNVHNNINGGVQHGPVIQSGRITGLTIHAHPPTRHRTEPLRGSSLHRANTPASATDVSTRVAGISDPQQKVGWLGAYRPPAPARTATPRTGPALARDRMGNSRQPRMTSPRRPFRRASAQLKNVTDGAGK